MGKVNSKSIVFRIIRLIIYTGCFTGVILFLNEYDNVVFETQRAGKGAWAFLFFGIALLAMQRVRWLNWQSALVTVLYIPVAILECKIYVSSADLLLPNILSCITQWMTLMVVTDMVVTGRVRKIRKFRLFAFTMLCISTALLLAYTRGQSVDKYLMFVVMCLIPLNEEDWDEVMDGLLLAGLISFIYVTAVSFMVNPYFGVPKEEFMKKNPEQGGRWYGYFMNIGTFGQYLGLSSALAVCGLFRSREKWGRLSAPYFISWFWLAGSVFLSALNATRNYMVGMAGLIIILFIFGFRKSKTKGYIIRGAIVTVLIAAAGFAIIRFGMWVLSPEFDQNQLTDMLMKTPLKLVPSGTKYVVNKFVLAHNGYDSGFEGYNPFPPYSIWSFLNILTSMRLGIGYEFIRQTAWEASTGDGIQYGTYFAYNAHNQYVQALYVFGFFAGGTYILYVLSTWVLSIAECIKTRRNQFYLALILITVMVAMWLGERSTIYYPLTFVGLFAAYPILVNCLSSKKAEG